MELKSITFHEGEEIYWNPEKQQYEGTYAGVYCCFKPDMVGHDGGIKVKKYPGKTSNFRAT